MIRFSIALVVAIACASVVAIARADSPKEETPCIEKEATNGARAGESREARIARLELQLRLSKAERSVNRR